MASLRANPQKIATALDQRKEGIKGRESLDSFTDLLLGIRDYLEVTKNDIYTAKTQALGGTPEDMVNILGLNPMIHYVKYESDKENLVHTLNEPLKSAIWQRFCEYASDSKNNTALMFFTLKGGIHMCITNVVTQKVPGEVHHIIYSGDPTIPDISIMKASQVPLFINPLFMKG